MELFQKIKNKKRRDPTCRIRTSDLRMSVRDQLQSSALPTELRSDFDIAYQLLSYSIFYFYYIAKWKGKEKHQRVQTSKAITNAIGTGSFILLLQRAERGSLPKCENRPHAFPYSLGTTGPRAFAQQAPSDLNVLLETGEPACEPNTGLTKLGYLKATFGIEGPVIMLSLFTGMFECLYIIQDCSFCRCGIATSLSLLDLVLWGIAISILAIDFWHHWWKKRGIISLVLFLSCSLQAIFVQGSLFDM